jgi:hypothetical protein
MKRICKTVAPCALCSETRELQDSHIIPRGCYNRLRGHERSTVNIAKGNAFLSQKQLRAKLLCRECEGKFNSDGEKYFLENCLQIDGGFPVDARIQADPNGSVSVGQGSKYWRSVTLGVAYDRLAYFAASLFWRTWAAKEKLPRGEITVDFPPELDAGLKDYLQGRTSVIPCASLAINVIKRLPPNIRDLRYVFSSPREVTENPFDFPMKFYSAECLGFEFWLFSAPEPYLGALRSHCILHHDDHPIFVSDAVQAGSVMRQVSWVRGSNSSQNLRSYRG